MECSCSRGIGISAVLQIIAGTSSICLQITYFTIAKELPFQYVVLGYSGTGLWSGIPFIAAGCLGVIGSNRNPHVILAYLIMSLVSAWQTIHFVILWGLSIRLYHPYLDAHSGPLAVMILSLIVGFLEFPSSILASVCCYKTIQFTQTPGTVHRYSKSVRNTGILQTVAGIFCLVLQVAYYLVVFPKLPFQIIALGLSASGFWCGIPFVVTGCLGVSARDGNPHGVFWYLIMSFICAWQVLQYLVIWGLSLWVYEPYFHQITGPSALMVLSIMAGSLELIAAGAASRFSCRIFGLTVPLATNTSRHTSSYGSLSTTHQNTCSTNNEEMAEEVGFPQEQQALLEQVLQAVQTRNRADAIIQDRLRRQHRQLDQHLQLLTQIRQRESGESNRIRELEREIETLQTLVRCPVCLDRHRDVVINSCGHSVCRQCVRRLTNCPECNRRIHGTRRLFGLTV